MDSFRWFVIAISIAIPCTSSAQASIPITSADSLALTLVIYDAAFARGVGTAHASRQPEVVCVSAADGMTDPPQHVVEHLQKDKAILVRQISACRTEPLRHDSESLVADTLTGKRGISISAGTPMFHDDGTFTVRVRYYQHGLSSASWLCRGRRENDGWKVESCRMEWIS